MTLEQIKNLVDVRCRWCGQTGRAVPHSKYCTHGDDPQGKNNHDYQYQPIMERELRDCIRDLLIVIYTRDQEIERLKPFHDAVIDAAVVDWTYTKEDDTDPRGAINKLLAMNSAMALDPAVSEPVAKMHQRITHLEKLLQWVSDYNGVRMPTELYHAIKQALENK